MSVSLIWDIIIKDRAFIHDIGTNQMSIAQKHRINMAYSMKELTHGGRQEGRGHH